MPLLVTGSTGRVGRALRAAWNEYDGSGIPVLFHARNPAQDIDIAWNIGKDAAPDLPDDLIILHLAGLTRGTAQELAENRHVTQEVCTLARDIKARHVFLVSSVAVYGPQTDIIAENVEPKPQSDYGRAKLDAEITASNILPAGAIPGLTILRLANLAGADALLGSCTPGNIVKLDPVVGQSGGPERSYIGPVALAGALAGLVALADGGKELPRILNLAQPPAVAMADLLTARGQPWRFGAPRAAAIPRVAVSTDRLAALLPLPSATPSSLIADLDSLQGRWP